MEIPSSTAGLTQLATSLSQNKLEGAVGVAVLKKAIDIQEQSAMQLIQSLPSATQGLPAHVGTKLNVTA
ncbi:YjfB family protein [Thiobaca trueperi]|uniref:Putative motility protein YjfB-like n=1 Tax=Thiobaca trueperi TaxID=127458 RepID=A0A4R3N4W5_9GAMM|nr:YjfB family protein [Thiobaca trueperi]TCT22143.1 putative motility protein YjfB-like [Thiobaca trueperi]